MAETTRTGPHRFVERQLTKMRLDFESEYDAFVPYCLDVFLAEFWVGIEVDGPHHMKRKDAERDAVLLERYAVPILRLPIKKLTAVRVQSAVMEFITAQADSAEVRRHLYYERLLILPV